MNEFKLLLLFFLYKLANLLLTLLAVVPVLQFKFAQMFDIYFIRKIATHPYKCK